MPTRRDAGELLTDTLCSWLQEIILLWGNAEEPSVVALSASNTYRRETMGFFTKDIKTLDDLFVHTLRGHLLRRTANH